MTSRVTIGTYWTFELDGYDAALVLKALGGRLRDDTEREAARELGDELTRQRAQGARSLSESMGKNEAAIGNRRDA